MRVKSIQLQGFRSFDVPTSIDLGQLNVFIGANNAGKSSILKSVYLMQEGSGSAMPDVRAGMGRAQIHMSLEEVSGPSWGDRGSGTLTITLTSTDRQNGGMTMEFRSANGEVSSLNQLPPREPFHFVVPYLSKRKTAGYQEDVRSQSAMMVQASMANLAAKLSRIANPSFPAYERYNETCRAILGFLVTAVPSENGQRPGVYLPNLETLPIDQMGEGVPNIVALLADLSLSKGKVFLIEEPENDLHPSALKALLDLIVESSESNQFLVSTHSNIVLRHLGAPPSSRVYRVDASAATLPMVSTVTPIEPTPQARLEVLRDLGYSFSDFDLWDGWLFLEEASAERIIRDYLIPWFAPKLVRVRTLSAAGVDNVAPTFQDFHRLVRFTHLEQAYLNVAWVRVDGDDTGKRVIERLQDEYPSWKPDRFAHFEYAQFERYYPTAFSERITLSLAIPDKQQRREAKRILLEDVRKWLDEDPERGKRALEGSAIEVINDLKKIESQLSE